MPTDVECIQAFWKRLKPEYDLVVKARQENYRAGPMCGFGIYDDDEYHRAQEKHAVEAAILLERLTRIEAMWNLVKEIYGKDLVSLAIDDLGQVIGTLPYIQ